MIFFRAEEKNLKIIVENNHSIPFKLFGDEVRIRQIVSNLLTNAVKYTKEGTITLTVDWTPMYQQKKDQILLQISVKDTGIGISEESQKVLFDSFQRVDERQNRLIEGTGLGLAITKSFLELMDGTINVESVYGKGSVFRAEIPQTIISDKPMGSFMENHENYSSQNKQYQETFHAPDAEILVVDDVQMNLDVIKALLKNTKVNLDTAASGEQCLHMIQKKKYHIIFMDHMMPEMDGIETFHAMQKIPEHPNKDTPVIALTANALTGAKEEYLLEGFTDYLSKPIRSHQLKKMIQTYLPKELVTVNKDLVSQDFGDSLLKKLSSFLDTNAGLSFCANDEKIYDTVIAAYLETDLNTLIRKYYAAQDWKNYQVQVHALKSTSLTIGANQLSEQAKKLETAAKEQNITYIQDHTEETLRDYQILLLKLKEARKKSSAT